MTLTFLLAAAVRLARQEDESENGSHHAEIKHWNRQLF